jgi:hypothetical protein
VDFLFYVFELSFHVNQVILHCSVLDYSPVLIALGPSRVLQSYLAKFQPIFVREAHQVFKENGFGKQQFSLQLAFYRNEIGCRRLNGRPREKYPRKQLSEK